MFKRLVPLLGLCSILLTPVQTVMAQASLPIYTDNLVNGFQNWSWAANDPNNSSPVHSGRKSISVSANYWEALSFHQSDFDATVYADLSFWVHGGASGGQILQVDADYGTSSGPAYTLPALAANTWQQYVIPLSELGVADRTNLNRISFQLTGSGTSGTFYVDDIQMTARPAPGLVHINVNAEQTIRSTDPRWFGVNAAIWDSNFDTAQTTVLLKEMGCLALRYPGGSLSDDYHWYNNRSVSGNFTWTTSPAKFAHIATNLSAQVFITANYGTGTPEEAAGWVRSSNVTNRFGYKNWEIGNENYGTWEVDANANPHDPYTYALRAVSYIQQMKAADPTIKVGVVVVPGEDSYANGYADHPAYNPRTGQAHNGWTPVVLSTLKSLGVTPDFVIHHVYLEYTPPVPPNPAPAQAADSDPLLLQAASNWAKDAADLRQQITDYFGAGGENMELVCTENNSDAGGFGRQLTSIVDGLYLADSLAQLMKTEFNSLLWWDLRNGSQTSGSFDPTLYGWRNVGDEGMIGGSSTRYPPFYAEKLMQSFVRPGDTVLHATSDYLLLSAYAARKADGGLALLVINKDATTNFNAQINLKNFFPEPTATVRSYGIAQDEATRTNGPASAKDIATNTFPAGLHFTNSFPPYSLTLLTFVPGLRPTTLTVTSTDDDGPGTLREALADAFDGDTINFSLPLPATITLTSGELVVANSVTLAGPGQANLAVDGNAASRVFRIASNNVVAISALTITNGLASGSSLAGYGGGIYNDHASLTISNCTLSGNSAAYGGFGGGIFNDAELSSASLHIVRSALRGNSVGLQGYGGGGGGIYNYGYAGIASVELIDSTLSGNTAYFYGYGGGIFNDGNSGRAMISIRDSALSGNSGGYGGAIMNFSATVEIAGSTLSDNSAIYYGGGIYNGFYGGNASAQILNSTLSGNSTVLGYGVIYNDLGAVLSIGSTILNGGASGENIQNLATLTSLGYNLSSDGGGAVLTDPTDQINTDPKLGPLQDNGGPTFTHAPACNSPANDHGKNFSAAATDQRGVGFVRTFDGLVVPNATGGDGTDIGAFEHQTVCDQPPLANASATPLLVISSNGTNATVVLDGSRSSDPDGDLLKYNWSESGHPVASGVVALNVLSVGTHSIQLVVSDGLLASTNGVYVVVITSAEAVNRLAALLSSDASRPQPLLATLRAALASIDRSNPVPAINQLLAFQNKVRAQVEPLDPALAASLIQSAEDIIDSLTDGSTNPGGKPHGRATSVTRQSNGHVRIQFTGEPGRPYLVEASTNLLSWEMIGTAAAQADGSFAFEDPQAARHPSRFYRVVSP